MIAGALMLVLAYPLALTVPAAAIDGRESRVHAMAGIAASLLATGLLAMPATPSGTRNRLKTRQALIAAWLTLLMGFSLSVQRDYATAWRYQQAFWSDVLRLCPDIGENTVILLASADRLIQPEQIDAQGWSLPVVLPAIFDFPAGWTSVPRLYRLKEDWQNRLLPEDESSEGEGFALDQATEWFPFLKPTPRGRASARDVILLEAADGRLIRRFSIGIGSRGGIPLKARGTALLPTYRTTLLHQALIRPRGESAGGEYLLLP